MRGLPIPERPGQRDRNGEGNRTDGRSPVKRCLTNSEVGEESQDLWSANPHVRRKAYTAVAAKIARTAHAVIKSGKPYRPFFEGAAQAEGPLSRRAMEA